MITRAGLEQLCENLLTSHMELTKQIGRMKNCYNCQHLRQYGLLRNCRKHNGTYNCLANDHALWELIKEERNPCD